MKKFIVRLILFCVPLVSLAFVADFVISKNLRKSTDRMLIGWNEIRSGKLHHDVVIMGSSRAWVQYDPQILDSILNIDSYNLGINGSLINRQVIKYNEYCRFNVKPKVILQNIDHMTMRITRGYEREQFFPYFHDSSFRNAVSHYENFDIFQKHLPLLRYYGYSTLILDGLGFSKHSSVPSVKGYQGFERSWDGSAFEKITTIYPDQDISALRIFDEYCEKACSEGIRMIFVYAPLYIGATERICDIDTMRQMYASIAEKYNIPILDYSDDPLCYNTNYFYNATHLNKTGAELFSAKLANDIKQLGLLESVNKR